MALPINIHFIGFSTVPRPGMMGGNTRILLEFARRLQTYPDVRVTLYIGEGARATCHVSGLDDRIVYRTIPEGLDSNFYSPLAHVQTSLAGLRVIRNFAARAGEGRHVCYSGSDFWPDVWGGWQLARQLKGLWIASVYLFAPSPLFGYLGEFTRRLHRPDPLGVLLWLYQRTTLALIRRSAHLIFLTNDHDRSRLRGARAYPDGLHAVYGGVDLQAAQAAPPDPQAEYAACFVGRLHPMKGIAQLLLAWAYVVRCKPRSRLAIIGVGRSDYEQQMRRLCRQLGLDASVDWLGYRDGPDKYAVLKKSRVFLHTSIYDNSGMAACEAMAVGVPVVMFDLPPLRMAYPVGVLHAPLGDTRAFGECIVRILSDEGVRAHLAREALELARQWTWDARLDAALDKIKAALQVM